MNTINTINKYLKNLLDPDTMQDIAINGIQVENDGCSIRRIAFAVDASYASMEKAIKEKCELLITHHGLYWGKVTPVVGVKMKRLKLMLTNNLGLISYHLPLDAHSEYGNNAQIMKKLGITDIQPFGKYKGNLIGYKGTVSAPLKIEQIFDKMGIIPGNSNVNYLGFGHKEIKSIAVVSGGAASSLFDAIENKVDLFITGDSSHELYHEALENRINALFAGHYFTETFGIKALQRKIEEDLKIDTVFCDFPTGL
ncbi:MAG: Nif3-like dinuclear metal center hexameric protein [Spirochaetes bacterium GWF1_31_7]|nr:MAG: Nif3-like dinuclear metal center hexameric protein [Spirochaetes bacterium GWE1_32_154]OHD48739.1 MAG: Nif3-like dinuclear metal center hexameric protein [Spirochaetes bacterium GWF1_31_7]OHD52523.1 MAG: Nif3-like dinuclear metal center hexameric protein [Spirochaetes bacterium GWE2_31_10]OHD73621.1 MAG: Nif3-like dinuclear metal center hexameric protein [Spirochaetes bacterium RIFOXYB1_FULL_32_8]HBD94058.1 Nif3-like dinuclear metal center hexameric protein [Spirochaetia bacterium]